MPSSVRDFFDDPDHVTGSGRKRVLVRCLVAALAVLILVPIHSAPSNAAADAGGASARHPVDPKVVIIVGPTGDVTDHYRENADEAAVVARRYSSSVTTLYSPNATWARVRAALQGASIVVYLGHGNGFPNQYHSQAWSYSENGLGLNVAGSTSDDEHQYYGEYFLRRAVKLAPNAVVILSHLCYASGSPEPGLPNPSLDVARQRVDNYAAGFLAIGASAVIADAHMGPAYYVEQVLRAHRGGADIWNSAPTLHGHVMSRPSVRTRGYREYLDPDTESSGYYRSLVVRPKLGATDVIDGATGNPSVDPPTDPDPPQPDRPPTTFGAAQLSGAPAAGSTVRIKLPINSGRRRLPADLTFNVRWDSLAPDDGTLALPDPANDAAAPPADLPAGDTTWIVPERQGDAVQTEVARLRRASVTARVQVPDVLGLYRLTISAADGDGVDLSTGVARQPESYLVTVIGALGVFYGTPATLDVVADEPTLLPIRLANSGAEAWWTGGTATGTAAGTLVATWVALGINTSVLPAPAMTEAPLLAPTESGNVALGLVAPGAPGEYLLVLDILTPDGDSLAVQGVPPHLLRVTVHQLAPAPGEPGDPEQDGWR